MPQSNSDKLEKLLNMQREIFDLRSIHSTMLWDQRVKMPGGSEALRSRQLSLLAKMVHERSLNHEYTDLLSSIEDQGFDLYQRAQLREAHRQQRRINALSTEMVEESSQLSAAAHEVWVDARTKSDFGIFAPTLEKMVDLKKREAEAHSKVGSYDCLYDALLDDYEPDMTAKDLKPVFDDLKTFLKSLIANSSAEVGVQTQNIVDQAAKKGAFSAANQRKFGMKVIETLGFDMSRGRVDVSVHPFCIGNAVDTRLTTRYSETDPMSSLLALVHEAGHGMYNQGLPQDLMGTSVGECRSLGVHESQSKIWENFVARGGPFWQHFLPILKDTYDGLDELQLDDFLAFLNKVQPSLIRVDADETTYLLHVIIRFELEQDLVHSRLTVKDLPQAWNELYEAYLGIRPGNDANGVLQDVHWAIGLFGYFPTYAIGNLFAAQLYAQALTDYPDMESQFADGDFSVLKSWLNEHVHQPASVYVTNELIEKSSKQKLGSEALKSYLTAKLAPIYPSK